MNRCQVRFANYNPEKVERPILALTFTRLQGVWTLHMPSGETEQISPTMWAKRQGLSEFVIAQTQFTAEGPVNTSD